LKTYGFVGFGIGPKIRVLERDFGDSSFVLPIGFKVVNHKDLGNFNK
jgi:hypothetical protein